MKTDVIVIGSGPIGAVCARNLAEQGLSVLMLEAGKAISSPPGEHLRNQTCYQENPDKFFDEINQWCHTYNNKASPEQLPGANVTEAFGGQGLLWTNNCPRPAEHELWPIHKKDKWNDLFTRAEDYFSVNKNLFDDSIRQQKIIEKLSGPLALQQRSIEKMPLAAKRLENNKFEFTATKEILDLPMQIINNIQIEMNSKVIELINHRKHVKGVRVKQKDKITEYFANHVIVAAGAFDTTQLLFDSQIRPLALGKYLHFHPLYIAQLVLKKDLCANENKSENIKDFPARLCIYPTLEYPWHAMILRDIFPGFSKEAVPQNALMDMQFFIPMEVQENNRMILSNGIPKFEARLSKVDEKNIKRAKEDLIHLAKQLGHFREGCEPRLLDFGFTHPMGMCRMGEDPKTSVVDLNGRVHGFSNLYLASVGLIPVRMAVNLTLTAAALAIASTDKIAGL